MSGSRPIVLVCDELAREAELSLSEAGFEVRVRTGLSEAALCEAASDARALIVRSATKVTARVIAAAPELSVIGRAGVGVDNVDVEAATARGVVVMNTPDGNTLSAAELTLAHLLALARNLPRANAAARAGWNKKGLQGTEVTGKTLGVIGLGRIGKAVARRALGLELEVLGHDPYLPASAESPLSGVELVTLDELLARSDFVSLHVPLTEETLNLLSRERLLAMKRGARLINVARGGLVDETALVEALERGHLRGAALDVLAVEPPPADHPLLARSDVILSPHVGASSEEAQRNVAIEIAAQVRDFLREGVARNAVNAPPMRLEAQRVLGPWLVLASTLGRLAAQVAARPIERLELEVTGELANLDNGVLGLALQAGVLTHGSEQPVNLVNAPRLAHERGLILFETRDGEAPQALDLTARCGRTESVRLSGAVFAGVGRLTRFDGFRVDLEARGPLLLTRHADEPGVAGRLCTALGSAGLNIRRMGIEPPEERHDVRLAAGFFALDREPGPESMAALRALPGVAEVRLVRM